MHNIIYVVHEIDTNVRKTAYYFHNILIISQAKTTV